MREPNLGIFTFCSICNRRFWTEDGYSICSPSCEAEYERLLEEEDTDDEY